MPQVSMPELLYAAPMAVCALGAFAVLLGEAVYGSRAWPRRATAGCFLLASAAAGAALSLPPFPEAPLFAGALFADAFAYFLQILIAGAALLTFFFSPPKAEVEERSEYYALLLMAVFGAMLFVSAAEFIVLFIGLETMSMALYALCGAKLGDRRSAEAALKYFLLGSFSSVLLLYGIALLYGSGGTTNMIQLAEVLRGAEQPAIKIGFALVLAGFLFKLALVPFHYWAPDAYEGAPTAVTAFMATAVKIAAFGALMRILWTVLPGLAWLWTGALWVVALATVIAGNVIALRQRSVKRMLAYSSISHAGYLSMALLVPGFGGPAMLFYLIAYVLMTVGAFGVVQIVASNGGSEDAAGFDGLGGRNPLLAGIMTLFMLSLAGVPPGFAGFLGKFYVLNALVRGGYLGLALIGILFAVVACAYYLRVVVAMYFAAPAAEAEHFSLSRNVQAVLLLCAAAIVLLGIFPLPVYGYLSQLMFK